MTLDELRAAGAAAEVKIRDVVRDLEIATGCHVRKIEIAHHYLSPAQQVPLILLDFELGGQLRLVAKLENQK